MEVIDIVLYVWFDFDESVEVIFVLFVLLCVCIMIIFVILLVMSDQFVFGIVCNGVVYMFVIIVVVVQLFVVVENLSVVWWFLLVGKEIFLGVCFGYVVFMVFWVVQMVGMIVDNMVGFNNVQMSNLLQGDQNMLIGNMLLNLVVILFYVVGGMLFLLGVVFELFYWWLLGVMLFDMSVVVESFLLQ